MATFATAFISMQRGHKVRRTGCDSSQSWCELSHRKMRNKWLIA